MKPSERQPEAAEVNPEEPRTGHEYDGITEYDNPMPGWWVRIFWATFIFSLGYYIHYQLTGNGPSVEDSYAAEMRDHREKMAAAALGGQAIDEQALSRLMQDPAMLKDGQAVYRARCVQCHADRGQGNIGPNLTDEHWLYGSAQLMDLYEVISNGRTQKGMPMWSRTLRPVELAQVAAFVGTLRYTNVPGRPAQGVRVAPPEAPEPGEQASTTTPAHLVQEPVAIPVPTQKAGAGATPGGGSP